MLEDFPKWRLLLILFIIIIGAVFILNSLPEIMANAPSNWDWPILPAMGMFGAALIIVSLVYFSEELKEGEFASAFQWSIVGMVLGFALVIAWLW